MYWVACLQAMSMRLIDSLAQVQAKTSRPLPW